jgi:hypothetical protein
MSAFVSGCPSLNDPPGFIRLKPLQILRRDLQAAKAQTTKLETGAGCPTFISIAQNVRTRRPKSGHCRRSSIVAGFIYNPLQAGPERVADPNRGFRFTKDLQPHGSIHALIRAGSPWVGMRVTVLSQPLETYAHLPSGEKVSQSAPPPVRACPSSLRSGSE